MTIWLDEMEARARVSTYMETYLFVWRFTHRLPRSCEIFKNATSILYITFFAKPK